MIHLSTRGRLQNVAAAVTIATMGWLIISNAPPVPRPGGDGGGIGIAQKLPPHQKLDRTWYYDEQDIVTIIKIWTKING